MTHKFVLLDTPATSKPIKAWVQGVDLEPEARDQLFNIATMDFVHSHVAVMPDVHYGMGATIGSVIATRGAIIPAAVGVDIGCGMAAQRTSLTASDLPDSLLELRHRIERNVPHGRTDNGGDNDRGAFGTSHPLAETHLGLKQSLADLKLITDKHPKLERAAKRAIRHAGTLGTGNHFVEVCLDEHQRVWVMLHSGSRGIGNAIGQYFINAAKDEMRKHQINLPDQDLAYLTEGSVLYQDYCNAVEWAQNFARINRDLMMEVTLAALRLEIPKPFTLDEQAVNCHHNYVSWENHFGADVTVTRKGAVRAREGELGIIPGSMGARSFIVRGRGNPESFCSCSHGAGRVMSRTKARKVFTLEDHAADTAGVECRKDIEVLDETPKAYKDIDAVMAAQSDLVEVVFTLKQVLCVKG